MLLFPFAGQGVRLVLALSGVLVWATGVVMRNVNVGSFRQSYCPQGMVGRVAMTTRFVFFGVWPIGSLIGGVLGTVFYVRTALWILAGANVLADLWLFTGPIKRHRDLPGMCLALADIPLCEAETADGPVLGVFRKFGGPGLLVPPEYGGAGADALNAVRVIRAMSSYSPSLGVAGTMHHFTVALLFALEKTAGRLTPAQLELMAKIAPGNLIVASGWAEGRTDTNILVPAATARVTEGGYLVNGGKKPCSLSRSMDLLTASVAVQVGGDATLAMLLIPADSPGITVHKFWMSNVLAGAESDEVRLTDVFVPSELAVSSVPDTPHRLDDLQTAGFAWFELLTTAVYIGATSALVEQALSRQRGSVTDRAQAAIEL